MPPDPLPDLPEIPPMVASSDLARRAYKEQLRKYARRYRLGAWLCFVGWICTTALPVILTAVAFIWLQAGYPGARTAVLWLTGLASMLGTIAVFSKFDQKWRANSAAVYDARVIGLALMDPEVPINYPRDALVRLQRRHEVRWESAKI